MRIGWAKGIKIGPITLDGWEVLLGGGVACIVANATTGSSTPILLYLGLTFLVLWVVAVVLVNLGVIRKRHPSGESGSESADEAS